MKTLGFIGMGNMAGAIAAGILQKGLMKKEEGKCRKNWFCSMQGFKRINSKSRYFSDGL